MKANVERMPALTRDKGLLRSLRSETPVVETP